MGEQESKTMTERGKQGLSQALKVDVGLVKFVNSATEFARKLERIMFVLTLRDLHLSLLIGGVGVVLILLLMFSLWLFLSVFGRVGLHVLAWLLGSLCLLPEVGRDMAWRKFLWLKAQKERRF